MSLWLAWNRDICLPLLPLHQLPIQLSVVMSRRGIDPFTDCRFIHCRINFCSAIVFICLKQFVEKHFKPCKDLESHKIFLCILHTPMILRFYYTCLFYVYAWLCEAYAMGYHVCVCFSYHVVLGIELSLSGMVQAPFPTEPPPQPAQMTLMWSLL